VSYDVVIVGAGVMGSAAAYWLSRAGKRVALLEKHTPAHVGAASGDHSRKVRYQYQGQDLYTEMVAEAVKLWKEFDRQLGTDFYQPQGALSLQSVLAHPSITADYDGLRRLGFEPRWLDSSQLQRMFPQFSNVHSGYFVEGMGGYIDAGGATRALVHAAVDFGAELYSATEVVSLRESGGCVSAAVAHDGRLFEGETFVVALGSWTSRLVPSLSIEVRPSAARVHYLKPADSSLYAFPSLPPFAVADTKFYGFPIHWRGSMKVAEHAIGRLFDPDEDREQPDPEALSKLREFLDTYMPDLTDAEVTYSKTCTYAMTPDSDFVIDFLPDRSNVLVATGFSGHGFKFGILIGQMLSELVVHGSTRWDLSRFSLSRTPTVVAEPW
jgi:N-methyl-L-tryptophan oxidase